ncbi:MAG: hypothetical protein OEU46_20885 [Alphaproteobacteria bacterium]|nr:hypothetical protein [Alphaproteobacteria bacterium]
MNEDQGDTGRHALGERFVQQARLNSGGAKPFILPRSAGNDDGVPGVAAAESGDLDDGAAVAHDFRWSIVRDRRHVGGAARLVKHLTGFVAIPREEPGLRRYI